ncbi:MAG TPA: hypothetical protein VKS60_20535 [Stellaceae bacterium]|nr:hypothetical protein [Stellaceae bacterium]
MADADHTTTPSAVSRRSLLVGVAAAPLAPVPEKPPESLTDPVVPLWREWQRRHARATSLCHRWQAIETQLARTIGFPPPVPAEGPISRVVDPSTGADAAAHQARWNAEAHRLGLEGAKRLENAAWDEEAIALHTVFCARATSLAGVEAKLALMARLCTDGSDDPDFPLPQLRSTLADVKSLRRHGS